MPLPRRSTADQGHPDPRRQAKVPQAHPSTGSWPWPWLWLRLTAIPVSLSLAHQISASVFAHPFPPSFRTTDITPLAPFPHNMRRTLRRSCAACARSKHSCDLGSPSCSRCVKRRVQCIYANEPLTATATPATATDLARLSPTLAAGSHFASVDPFESYPQTRLRRDHVQRLIHSCS